jgi:ABC-2 type transport system permease protein
MKKYLTLLKIRIQSRFSYKWHVFFEFFFGLIPIGVLILIWRRITADYGAIGGYTYDDFVAYYILSVGVTFFDRSNLMWKVDHGVRQGTFSAWFLKPMSLMGTLFTDMWARLISKLLMRTPALLFLCFILAPVRENYALSLGETLILIVYLFLYYGFILIYEMFWSQFIFVLKELGGIAGIVWNIRRLFTGNVMPLDLLPGWLFTLFKWAPFANGIYLSIQFMLGRADLGDLGLGALKIIGWSLLLSLLIKIIWPKIVKNYSGVGI